MKFWFNTHGMYMDHTIFKELLDPEIIWGNRYKEQVDKCFFMIFTKFHFCKDNKNVKSIDDEESFNKFPFSNQKLIIVFAFSIFRHKFQL